VFFLAMTVQSSASSR